MTDDELSFGVLLSRYRAATGLTQEELAERARLSARGIGDLERGVKTRPRSHTVRQLAEALQLSAEDRAALERAASAARATPPKAVTPPSGNFLGAIPTNELIAREEERERIRFLFTSIAEGRGYILLLGGAVGVGKTRLLQEIMLEARAQSFIVLTVRCSTSEQHTPYYAFLEALAGLMNQAPLGIRPECERAWKRIQRLTPTRRVEDGATRDGVVGHRQFYEAVAEALLLATRMNPVALLIDDLQWADVGSLKLLLYLARGSSRARLLLASAFIDDGMGERHPDLAQAFQVLSRERLVERMTVRRLSLEDTTHLVTATMGQEVVTDEFATFVYRRTKGNPRLIEGLIRSLGGRLELQEEIGAGAMGRGFRAYDHVTHETVAAKLVLARSAIELDALLRWQHEGAALARLHHPHIVRIVDTFAEEHASCIIMELLDGQSLAQLLRDGPLSLPRAKLIAIQVADALGYAHSQEIVHRDIKPDNVMVLADDHVKVTDFGIARILQPDTSLRTIATTGMRMGTPLYMAPEQIEGKALDGRADIYALGAMLYQMVTGRPPFEGSDALEVAVKHLQEKPILPSSMVSRLPTDWDAVILKAIVKDPAKRFQSAKEMGQAIRALTEHRASVVKTSQRRWATRVAGLVGVLAAAVAAILGGLTFQHDLASGASTPMRVKPARAILASFYMPFQGGFTRFAFPAGALWVTSPANGDIVRFDTRTYQEVAVVKVGNPARDPQSTDPFDLVSVGKDLWATDRADKAVVRINPVTNKVTATVHIGISATSLAVVGNTLWASADPSSPASQQFGLVRVNLRTQRVAVVTNANAQLGFQIAATANAVWVLTPFGTTEVERIDPATDSVVASVATAQQPESLAAGDGAAWVLNQPGTIVSRIDPRANKVSATIDVSRYPGLKGGCACHNVAVGEGAVWVIARNRTLLRIDPRSNRVTAALTFKRDVYEVAVGDGSVWVGDDDNLRYLEIDRINPRAME